MTQGVKEKCLDKVGDNILDLWKVSVKVGLATSKTETLYEASDLWR